MCSKTQTEFASKLSDTSKGMEHEFLTRILTSFLNPIVTAFINSGLVDWECETIKQILHQAVELLEAREVDLLKISKYFKIYSQPIVVLDGQEFEVPFAWTEYVLLSDGTVYTLPDIFTLSYTYLRSLNSKNISILSQDLRKIHGDLNFELYFETWFSLIHSTFVYLFKSYLQESFNETDDCSESFSGTPSEIH